MKTGAAGVCAFLPRPRAGEGRGEGQRRWHEAVVRMGRAPSPPPYPGTYITSWRLPSFGYVRSASNPSPTLLCLAREGAKTHFADAEAVSYSFPFAQRRVRLGGGRLPRRGSCLGAVAGLKPAARALHQSLPPAGWGGNRHYSRDATPRLIGSSGCSWMLFLCRVCRHCPRKPSTTSPPRHRVVKPKSFSDKRLGTGASAAGWSRITDLYEHYKIKYLHKFTIIIN